MKLKIKEEYLDTIIFCPFTKSNIPVRLIDDNMYANYSKNGYSNLFEIDAPKKVIKEIKPTDDLPKSGD
jgi:hypothetical protein